MIKIHHNIFIGNEDDCFYDNRTDWAVIHACKLPCHCYTVGYRGNLDYTHPNDLIKETPGHLIVNLVDMKYELNPYYTHPIVAAVFSFIRQQKKETNILIHCNQGASRAPSIGLLLLAKIGAITNESYSKAREEFINIYPTYRPSGIGYYLERHWQYLLSI